MTSTTAMSPAMLPYPSSFSSHVQTLLQRLHAASSSQEASISPSTLSRIRSTLVASLSDGIRIQDDLMRDKFIALDQDKALLVYNLIIASGTPNIVEVGTSFGVSTIYLAVAARENAARAGAVARVIGTEKEASKAAIAKGYWRDAGSEIEEIIQLRVGDLKETLKEDVGDVGFVLLDIWPHVALSALNLLIPRLTDGAIVVTDNTIASEAGYKDLLSVLRNADGPFSSVTLPYKGGFELSVYRKPKSA